MWTSIKNGKAIKLVPTNKEDLGTGMTNCLFVDGFIRGSNARLRAYGHTARLADDGRLEITSKGKAQARFIFGWKSVRGTGTNRAVPTTAERLADWLSECDFA